MRCWAPQWPADFVGGADGFAQFDDGMAFHEPHDDGGAVEGPPALGFHGNVQLRHWRGGESQARAEECGRHQKQVAEVSPITHDSIIRRDAIMKMSYSPRGRNGFDGIESLCEGVSGSELP